MLQPLHLSQICGKLKKYASGRPRGSVARVSSQRNAQLRAPLSLHTAWMVFDLENGNGEVFYTQQLEHCN